MIVGARTIVGLGAARTLVAYCALVSFVYGTDSVLFVSVSQHRLGTGSDGFGYLLVALGVGGVLMAGAVDRAAGSPRLGAIILAGALGYSLPTALLVVIHSPVLAFVLEVFRGGSTLIVDVLAITALQRAVPGDQLARVFGVFFAFVIGAIALGTIITPLIVSALGLTGALWAAALAPAGIALAGYPALRAVDRDTAARARELEPKVALLEALGLFSGASRPILERLAAAAAPVEYEPGTDIVREGEPSDAIYLLTDGQVTVRARGELAPESQVIRIMDAPAYFGEIGVLEGIPRTATVAALGPVRCERIEANAMLNALTTAPPSGAMMESARTRLAITHPSRRLAYTPPAAPAEAV
jgi:CRP-like cAMP-binding protein